MILLTLSRGNEHERVHLRLPASPAEIGEAFVILDGISLDTTTTAILDVRGNVPGLYRYLYDVDVEDSEQFQKLQQLVERTDALSPEKAAIFSGALDAEHAENLDEALAVANRLDEYMLIGNITSDSELGAYPSEWDTGDKERNVELADELNEHLGVTPIQRQAMEVGSMAGWDVPGADPAKYQENYPKMGGMDLG